MGNSMVKYEQASIQLPNTEDLDLGLGPIYRNKSCEKGLILSYYEGCDTLWDLFCHGMSHFSTERCFGTRKVTDGVLDNFFTWMNYKEVEQEVIDFSNGISSLNLLTPVAFDDHQRVDGKNYHLVAFFAKNRYEWTISEYGIFRLNGALVPLYDVLNPKAIEHILLETGIELFVCDAEKCEMIAKILLENRLISVKTIITYDSIPEETINSLKSIGIGHYTYRDIINEGKGKSFPEIKPDKEDPCLIVYTSGTTGIPKGVITPHRSLASLAQSTLYHSEIIRMIPGTCFLSYLPLAHVFEQFCQSQIISSGGCIGFYTDRPHLMDDLKVLRPTCFVSVPRIYSRMKDTIMNNVRSVGGIKKYLFERGMKIKLENMKNYNQISHSFYDIIFNKIKATIGLNNLRFCLNGSAPISSDVCLFFRAVFGVPFMQGYGLTETGGGLCCELSDCHCVAGTCGVPVYASEIRLVSVPDLHYFVSDRKHGYFKEGNNVIAEGEPCNGRGEVVCRGYNVTTGYFRRPDITRMTIDDDGWFHTGDIGLWTSEGFLKMIDRKKQIVKLSQGEYVSLESIENNYLGSSFIDQIFVYGDSYRSFLVAIVVPDFAYCKYWLKEQGKGEIENIDIVKTPEIKAAILRDINENIVKIKRMNGIEKIREIYLECNPFTVEDDLITPTMKLKRIELKKKYDQEIDELYKLGDMK